MSDEIVQQDQQKEAEHIESSDKITLKSGAVEVTKPKEEYTGSDALYHTKETAKIAEERAKEIEDAPEKPYEYTANGYTVKKVDTKKGEEEKWEVTAEGDFKRGFLSQRDGEIYAETHSPLHKDLPATISKA